DDVDRSAIGAADVERVAPGRDVLELDAELAAERARIEHGLELGTIVRAFDAKLVAIDRAACAAAVVAAAARLGAELGRQENRRALRDLDALTARIEVEQYLAGLGRASELDLAFGAVRRRRHRQRRFLGAGDAQRIAADREILGFDLEIAAIAA